MRAALFSGGKESLYAAMKHWPPDILLFLLYRLPQPSPHIINFHKAREASRAMGIPLVLVVLSEGRERYKTVEALKRLGVSELVAGDVAVEEHLSYLEGVCEEAGCRLREPLWGLDTRDLLHEEVEDGLCFVVIGGVKRAFSNWVGRVVNKEVVEEFVAHLEKSGVDYVGEHGEYHTLVIDAPVYGHRLGHRLKQVLEIGDSLVAQLL